VYSPVLVHCCRDEPSEDNSDNFVSPWEIQVLPEGRDFDDEEELNLALLFQNSAPTTTTTTTSSSTSTTTATTANDDADVPTTTAADEQLSPEGSSTCSRSGTFSL
jgi:hypothetical protein